MRQRGVAMAGFARRAAVLLAVGGALVVGVRRASDALEGELELPIRTLAAASAAIGQRGRSPLPASPAAVALPSASSARLAHDARLAAFRSAPPTEPSSDPSSPFETLPKDWNYNLECVRKVSEGSMSKVYIARLRKAGEDDIRVAVKQVKPKTEEDVKAVRTELKYLQKTQGVTGVVTLYRTANARDLSPGQEVLYLMEPAAGNLEELVIQKSFAEVQLLTRFKLLVDIVGAVRDLEMLQVSHRNLTPENVLVLGDCRGPQDCTAVLCDFKHAFRFLNGPWRAVSVAADGKTMLRPDIASLAVIMFRLLGADTFEWSGPLRRKEVLAAVGTLTDWEELMGAEDLPTMSALVLTLQDLVHPESTMTATELVQQLQIVASAGRIDISPRGPVRLKGWSTWRSTRTKLFGK